LPLFPELITLLLTLLPTADTDTVDVAVFAAGEIGAKYVSDSLKGGITMFGSVISENQPQIPMKCYQNLAKCKLNTYNKSSTQTR
jgi:hypothetical protein